MTREHTQLTVYGTWWCPDVRRARRFLDEHGIAYTYIDIEQDREACAYCDEVHGGSWIVPTIAFPDGTLLFDPSASELAAKLGIEV
ncbi:MAG TPA: glutaredoxin domain-containing protein [Anaerolineae bacterium]|nr:glutaredoxin domain-containing protein [Anaerolineae bacterium]HQK13902.1 glutaredoxin domain-containing protein [Anaerolineae bacterium]